MASGSILSLDEALLTIKQESRNRYRKVWKGFLDFCPNEDQLLSRMPKEDELTAYFKHLRETKKMASSSLWTYYSMLNSVIRGIYRRRLQEFPRNTSLLKAYDVDIKTKASCFNTEDIAAFVGNQAIATPFWLVRKACIKKYTK